MKLPVRFKESDERFTADFGEITEISNGAVATPTQEKTVEITANGAVDIVPDDGYALSKVTANVNVPIPDMPPLQIESLIRANRGHIDTGVDGANSNLKIEVKFSFVTLPTRTQYWALMRAYKNETSNTTRILFYGSTATYCGLNSLTSDSLVFTVNRTIGTIYTEVLKPESSTVFSYSSDSTNNKPTKTRKNGEDIAGTTIKLFQESTGGDGISIKLYSLKIYDGDTLIRDYTPDAENGEIGLRDNVSGLFYGNSGEGSFGAAYVQSAGE